MKFSFLSLFFFFCCLSLNAQNVNFSAYEKLDTAVLEARLEIKRLIEQNNFEPIRNILAKQYNYVTDSNPLAPVETLSKVAIVTNREQVILQFLLNQPKELLSGVVHLQGFFSLKHGALPKYNLSKTPLFDSINLTLDILPTLKKINIDSLIDPSKINYTKEDVDFLKLYWKEILCYIESKASLSPEFAENGKVFLQKHPELDYYTQQYINSNFIDRTKVYSLSSFNIGANYQHSIFHDSLKTNVKIKPGLDFNIGFSHQYIELGVGYNFYNFNRSDSLFKDESLLVLPHQNLTQNTLYGYVAFKIYKWQRLETKINVKAGKARIYHSKSKKYTTDVLSYGVDFNFNLSKYYQPQNSLLTYKKEEFVQYYSSLILKIAPEFQVDILNPTPNDNAVLFNLRIGLVWKMGKFKPSYVSNRYSFLNPF